jgi:isovaleryl-CoA dehydrogenase
VPVLQHSLAEAWMEVEKAGLLVHRAAELGDLGDPHALPLLLASKIAVAEAAVRATNEAMTLTGGSAYRENGKIARLLRDARAAHVMAPTTDLLKSWVGKTLLGQPLF